MSAAALARTAGASARATLACSIEPLSSELVDGWRGLADRTAAAPFVRPGWMAAWWRAFGRGTPVVACARRAGRLAAALPLGLRRGRLVAPANDHTPVFGALAEDADALAALAVHVFAGPGRSVTLGHLDGEAAVRPFEAGALAAGRRTLRRPYGHFPYVTLCGVPPDARLASGRRADLRRCRRRLAEQGAARVACCTGGPELERALDEALAVESLGWKGRAGVAMASRPETAGFYRDVARWADDEGTLRLYSLRLDARAIAVYLGLEANSELFLLKGGYDPALRRCSPGRVLLADVLGGAAAAGVRRVHLLGAAEPYKLEWADGVEERWLLQAFARSSAGTVEWGAFAWGRPLLKRTLRRRRG